MMARLSLGQLKDLADLARHGGTRTAPAAAMAPLQRRGLVDLVVLGRGGARGRQDGHGPSLWRLTTEGWRVTRSL